MQRVQKQIERHLEVSQISRHGMHVPGACRGSFTELDEFERVWILKRHWWSSSLGSAVGASCDLVLGGVHSVGCRRDAVSSSAYSGKSVAFVPNTHFHFLLTGPDDKAWSTLFPFLRAVRFLGWGFSTLGSRLMVRDAPPSAFPGRGQLDTPSVGVVIWKDSSSLISRAQKVSFFWEPAPLSATLAVTAIWWTKALTEARNAADWMGSSMSTEREGSEKQVFTFPTYFRRGLCILLLIRIVPYSSRWWSLPSKITVSSCTSAVMSLTGAEWAAVACTDLAGRSISPLPTHGFAGPL